MVPQPSFCFLGFEVNKTAEVLGLLLEAQKDRR